MPHPCAALAEPEWRNMQAHPRRRPEMSDHDILLEAGWLIAVPLLITVFVAEMVLT
jgi:hypothetical protein